MDWTHEQGFLYALVCVNVRHSQGMDATKGFITVYAPLRAMAPTLADVGGSGQFSSEVGFVHINKDLVLSGRKFWTSEGDTVM